MKETGIRISVVSYLNAKPFMRGLEQSATDGIFETTSDIPSICAQKLLDDKADIGLIPVAMIPRLKESHIISDYCIAGDGKVESVLLVSQVPLEQIRSVVLDMESRTSVMLAKILCKEYWNLHPDFIPQTDEHHFSQPDKTGAAVMIGDKALEHRHRYTYVYDLAEAWKEFTGLPFVFAAWVSNKAIAPQRIAELNQIFERGIREISTIAKELADQYPYVNVDHYLTENIRYILSTRERKGLQLFLEKLKDFTSTTSGAIVAAVDVK